MKTPALTIVTALLCAGCASPVKTFYPTGAPSSWQFEPKKSASEVQFLQSLPASGFAILGELAIGGRPNNSFQDMIEVAQKEAMTRGADFIVVIKQDVQTQQVAVPGFSTQQSSGSAAVSANGATAYGTAQSQGSGFSIGPSVRTVQTGSMNFLLGKYPRVWLGLIFDLKRSDGKALLTDFSWDSLAPKAGLKLGDEVLALDGRDIKDPEAGKPLFYTAKAGEVVTVVARRAGERLEFQVPYIDRFPKKKTG